MYAVSNPFVFVLLALGLFVGILVMAEFGRRLRRRHAELESEAATGGAAEGTAFALLGLLIAFTFAGAADRFDERRALVVEEANIIGTTYLRLDLLPDSARGELQAALRSYVDSRLAVYAAVPDMALVRTRLAESEALQKDIWRSAVRAAGAPGAAPGASMLLLPSLNEMFDITTTRTAATLFHPPPVIYGLLAGAALVCALIVGYDLGATARRRWLKLLVFATVVTAAIYVALDLEYPRAGLIRVNAMDGVLVEVRRGMGP